MSVVQQGAPAMIADAVDRLWSVRGIPNDVRLLAAQEARAAGVPIGQWVSYAIRTQAWKAQRPEVAPTVRRKEIASHLIYIHVDPRSRQLLYVGISGAAMRPNDFSGRSQRHKDKLRELLAAGCTRSQIRHIVARGLGFHAAVLLERDLILKLKPPLNGPAPRLWAV